jgi:FtsH-binding integral membrane protein
MNNYYYDTVESKKQNTNSSILLEVLIKTMLGIFLFFAITYFFSINVIYMVKYIKILPVFFISLSLIDMFFVKTSKVQSLYSEPNITQWIFFLLYIAGFSFVASIFLIYDISIFFSAITISFISMFLLGLLSFFICLKNAQRISKLFVFFAFLSIILGMVSIFCTLFFKWYRYLSLSYCIITLITEGLYCFYISYKVQTLQKNNIKISTNALTLDIILTFIQFFIQILQLLTLLKDKKKKY